MNLLKKYFSQGFTITIGLMLICGLGYPLAMTAISQIVFHDQANNSLVYVGGEPVGSIHVGQKFTKDCFMKSRPSAVNYNTFRKDEDMSIASGSNNYAPSNPKLKERVAADTKNFLIENPSVKVEDVPGDIVTASGSGLDPHISVEAALIQIPQLSKVTGIDEAKLKEVVANNTKHKLLGVFGNDVVNVLAVNLDIMRIMNQEQK